MADRGKRWALTAALVVGMGVAAAPAAFQMFSRAPLGGTMIDDFRPYMSNEKIDTFRGYMTEIDAAVTEADQLRSSLVEGGTFTADEYDTQFFGVGNLTNGWAAIDADMTDLLDRMDANMANYAAVDALPPFAMFPWFFVIPGLAIAVVAAGCLWSARAGRAHRGGLWALAGLGIALVAAPFAFQMFSRAPMGAEMIDDFRPMMTRDRVQNVQGHFITLGGAEGQLRVAVMPALVESGGDAADYPAITQFSTDWPSIVTEFNPMIATMSDNVDNFQAVDALPSFSLFPWFFVVPGALVAGLAAVSLRRTSPPTSHLETDSP
ncbi:MAG: hypothetical protein KBF94_08280 [Ilumatobacteraceae bacterium]|nr:hypothetical protein [Ilumatobacteraceae bacterium]